MGSISSIAASAAQAAVKTSEPAVDVGFTARLAGKTYDADVTFTDGQYIAIDPAITGAEANGTSLTTAENNLVSRIDALV